MFLFIVWPQICIMLNYVLNIYLWIDATPATCIPKG